MEQGIVLLYLWDFSMLVTLRKNLASPDHTEDINIYTWSVMPRYTLYKALQLGVILKNMYLMLDDSVFINTR